MGVWSFAGAYNKRIQPSQGRRVTGPGNVFRYVFRLRTQLEERHRKWDCRAERVRCTMNLRWERAQKIEGMNENKAGDPECGPEKVRLSGEQGPWEAGLLAKDLEINRRAMEAFLVCSECYLLKVTLFCEEKGLEKSKRGGGDVSQEASVCRPGATRWWLGLRWGMGARNGRP